MANEIQRYRSKLNRRSATKNRLPWIDETGRQFSPKVGIARSQKSHTCAIARKQAAAANLLFSIFGTSAWLAQHLVKESTTLLIGLLQATARLIR
jgi:hypothetical protein